MESLIKSVLCEKWAATDKPAFMAVATRVIKYYCPWLDAKDCEKICDLMFAKKG